MSISELLAKKLNHAGVNLSSLFRKNKLGTELITHQDDIATLKTDVDTLEATVGIIGTDLNGLTSHIEILTGIIDSSEIANDVKTYSIGCSENVVCAAFCYVYGSGTSSPITSTTVNLANHEIDITFANDANLSDGLKYIIFALKELPQT